MLAIMPLHLHVVEMPLMQLFKMLSKQEQMADLDAQACLTLTPLGDLLEKRKQDFLSFFFF